MDRLLGMEVFVKVVDCGSFTRAAAALSLSTPMVSTHVSQLENHLGVRLLNRTTRRMELTQDGEAYYGQCQRILAEIGETEASLARNSALPQGRVRIDVPMTICEPLILPVIPEFRRRYPDIALEIGVSNHALDISDTGYDVAIRHSAGDSATMVARPLGFSRIIIVAAPDYLERRSEPKSPEDLAQHDCINVLDVHTGRIGEWIFERNGEMFRRHFPGVVAFSHGGPRKQLALQGLGVVQLLKLQVAEELRRKQLKRILKPWERTTQGLSLLYQKNRHLSAKVRAFVDFIQEKYPQGKEIDPPPLG